MRLLLLHFYFRSSPQNAVLVAGQRPVDKVYRKWIAQFWRSYFSGYLRLIAVPKSSRRSIKKLFLKFCNIHRKTPVLESLFNKVAGLRLQHRCFFVNIWKILSTTILKNICERLILCTSLVLSTMICEFWTNYYFIFSFPCYYVRYLRNNCWYWNLNRKIQLK